MSHSQKAKGRRWRFFSSHPVLLIDEAFHLLRTIPVSFFLVYFLGVLPFIAGFIYYVSMMLHDAYAPKYVIPATVIISVLFLWMKTWQARFSSLLWGWLGGLEPPELTPRFFATLSIRQACVQSFGLLLIPLAFMSIIFFPPFYMFFQRASLISSRKNGDIIELSKTISAQPPHAFSSTYMVVWSTAIIWLFMFVGVLLVGTLGPLALKSLLGIDTPFSRGEASIVSGYLGWTVLLSIIYCMYDPLIRAVTALDLFYLEAEATGVDLLAEFRGFLRKHTTTLLVPIIVCGLISNTQAADVDPDQFEESVRTTLQESDYRWRMPREELLLEYDESGWIEKVYRFTEENAVASWKWIESTLERIWNWITNLLQRWFTRGNRDSSTSFNWLPSMFGWAGPWIGVVLRWIVAIGLVALVGFGSYKLFKYLKNRKQSVPVIAEPAPAGPVNLEDEELTADQLPEDDWMLIADDLISKGDLRLAMRAMYLALLAFLGDRRLISIAKFKSNFDYVTELKRRQHELPTLMERFQDNVTLFEYCWYGMHDVRNAAVERFKDNAERIRNDVQN